MAQCPISEVRISSDTNIPPPWKTVSDLGNLAQAMTKQLCKLNLMGAKTWEPPFDLRWQVPQCALSIWRAIIRTMQNWSNSWPPDLRVPTFCLVRWSFLTAWQIVDHWVWQMLAYQGLSQILYRWIVIHASRYATEMAQLDRDVILFMKWPITYVWSRHYMPVLRWSKRTGNVDSLARIRSHLGRRSSAAYPPRL